MPEPISQRPAGNSRLSRPPPEDVQSRSRFQRQRRHAEARKEIGFLFQGGALLDWIKTRPELPAQAQETALAFLEGGLTAGCFGALTAWTFQSAVLRESIAGEAEKLRQQLHAEGPEALQATLTAEQEKGRAVYARSSEPSQDFRGLMQEAFVIGYRVGAAEALLVLG